MKKSKKILGFIGAVMMMVATMGMTALAASSGVLTGALSNDTATATLKNTSEGKRFCQVTVLEYDNNPNVTSTVAVSSGNISPGNTVSASGKVSKAYARAVGSVYNSETQQSGVAKSYNTQIK